MGITERGKRQGQTMDALDVLVEFLGAQDFADRQELRDHIERNGDLQFVQSKPLSDFGSMSEADDPARGGGSGMPCVSELSPQTKKALRKARPSKIVPALPKMMLLGFWVLIFSALASLFEFPSNYVLGAVFLAPTVLWTVKLIRNIRHREPW